MNILLIGPYGKPLGGVSIHILRLEAYLITQGHSVRIIDESNVRTPGILNLRSLNVIALLKLFLWADNIHIHSGVTVLRTFHLFAGKLLWKRCICTLHSLTKIQSDLSRWWNTLILNTFCNEVVVVNQTIKVRLKLETASVISPFFPPLPQEFKDLPNDLVNRIDAVREAGGEIIVSNASSLAMFQGKDLYGLDTVVQVARLLKERKAPVLIVFVVVNVGANKSYFNEVQTTLKKEGLSEVMILLEGGVSFLTLIQQSDVVLRLTRTDGDSLTVREGLSLGKKVIVTNVGFRPQGVTLVVMDDARGVVEKIVAKEEQHTALEYTALGVYDRLYN